MLEPKPGAVVGGKYRILRPLGEGGMGSVYEAENLLTLKLAAIKWLHPRLEPVEDARRRLLHEARAMARVRHRNVVDVYDVVTEESSVFLIMELLRGEGLHEHVRQAEFKFHQLVALLLPAMRGVGAAHAAGVVHRDIKPENIFLAREHSGEGPVPKVIDFGISRMFSTSDEERLTRSGMTMGTARYVSYEQLRGARDVDARADVYAFGVILYEALVGRPPYNGITLSEQAIKFATTFPALPHEARPEVPEPLSRLVGQAIAKERDERIRTIEELLTKLEPYALERSYRAPLPSLFATAQSPVVSGHGCTATTAPAPHEVPERAPSAGASASVPEIPHRRRSLSVPLLATLAAAIVLIVVRGGPSDDRSRTTKRHTGAATPPAHSAHASAALDPSTPGESLSLPLSPLLNAASAPAPAQTSPMAEPDAAERQRLRRFAPGAKPARGGRIHQGAEDPPAPEMPALTPPILTRESQLLRAGGMSEQEF